MSLSLLQGYSSAEDEEEVDPQFLNSSDEEEPNGDVPPRSRLVSDKPLVDPNPPSSSSLPSALDAFSEVEGPPQFLNNAVEEAAKDAEEPRWRHGRKNRGRDKKDLPAGAVLESKPQLVGIHERVRSDVGGATPAQPSTVGTGQGGKRMSTVSNPSAEDASELLRICVRCGVPKTYTNSKGIVCPVCSDRPPADEEAAKKRGSAVKDKEKLKRMKGQSSHASWKSETEMQLRQQFD